MERTGGCLCGAVRFSARDVPDRFGACHCEMCRRWTGSALLGVTVPAASVAWAGPVATRQTSAWAERAWCRDCGSGVWFRVTRPGPHADDVEIPIGLFDDPSGFRFDNEIYIDVKPDSYAYAGEGRRTLTRAECMARYAAQGLGPSGEE
jgi:hypothetical protein